MKLTLRAKGILAFMVLLGYIGMVALILAQERAKLLRYAVELEQIYTQESALAKASYAVSHTLLKWQEKFISETVLPAFEDELALDMELAQAGLQGLLEFYPELEVNMERLNRDLNKLSLEPAGSGTGLKNNLRELTEHLDQVARQLRTRRDILWDRYRDVYGAISVTNLFMGLFGVVFFGAVVTLFLTRLALDAKKLAARALDIVSGYRGPPLEVTRHDEVGGLMEAVNRMQFELRRWEQQLEIAREQRFHKEKMAAIGSLAAAVAHEINNPIAAIAGIAQSMKDSGGYPAAGETGIDPPELILAQAKRIATISRQIAELTAPHSPEQELLDLNALVRNTCNFIGYDHRFRRIDMVLQLDSQIPAVSAIADHLTQVLMNLLINAADALEGVTERQPTIRIATQATEREVSITVHDNGKGMSSEVLARAFEESYTTKPPDKGRGLGLFLCKSLIEDSGNRIELESKPGSGTTARIRLTLPTPPTGA
ncbi:MAG: ATP-binding protein [Rhodoferax sp.]|uniref:sensor histidine kinase n=1 Tax=Rhodoferax sp. TaxID=50421 RepID=UPI002607B04D|nr:ATP-binding protein [Rhodoferax sp.]MDD5335117.1 ATP-binding protein [Rhodoferax sp.]